MSCAYRKHCSLQSEPHKMQAYEAFPLLQPVPLSTFGEAFDKFTSSAFRLECLPIYAVEEEHSFFLEYKSTGKCSLEFNSEWLDFLDAAQSTGKTVHRSRVLPKSGDNKSYFRFEVDCGYRKNLEHGEVVKFLDQDVIEQVATTVPFILDFWLFDMNKVFTVHYDVRGVFLGASELHSSLVPDYVKLAELLFALSTTSALDDVLARNT